ncbi:hypothetical protein AcW2_000075 [Taiwanofungus camphoratus]|nr:hypothetical protein AcW2_000075 [Antrodia cinnamomea]
MDHRYLRPLPPTASLPPLARLTDFSSTQIRNSLQNLRAIYVDPPPRVAPATLLLKHLMDDTSIPDSGYASPEEDEDNEAANDDAEGEGELFDPDILRSDVFEREYAIRWLTGFTARSDVWTSSADSDTDLNARTTLVDAAASLLAVFAGNEEEGALTRRFVFTAEDDIVEVELNDAPLLREDHTSVGLQSWASSILLTERICASPEVFGLSKGAGTLYKTKLRVLELGAGTGLLSIAAAKLLRSQLTANCLPTTVVATDYHPSVLTNLQANVDTNFFPSVSTAAPITVCALDWQNPAYDGELSQPFHVVLAADVIYHPEHARWIKDCVERLLVRPDGLFWLIIPMRITGRHEGMSGTVEAVFPHVFTAEKCEGAQEVASELAIFSTEELERHEGVGRADEDGYRLYRIGWAPCGRS